MSIAARADSGAIFINSRRYMIAKGTAEAPSVRVEQETAGPNDLAPFTDTVAFGAKGMGSSLPAVSGQHDYSLNCWVEDWDELAPGYDVSRLTDQTGTELAFDNPVVAMETVFDASGNKYLYVGEGANLHKFRLTAIGGNAALRRVAAATAFSHGSSTTISDICRLKEGSVTQYDRLGIAYSSDAYLIIGFGETAQIQQIDAIGVDTVADTYKSLHATRAYGGVFGVALGVSATAPVVFKSTGVANQNSGAFACVQTATIQNSTGTNYTQGTTSTPWGTLLQVGDFATAITAIIPWGRSALVAKPEGLFTFDQNYAIVQLFAFTGYRHRNNGRGLTAWGERVAFPTVYGDLKLWPANGDATAGISRLLSVLGPHRELTRITACASTGRYLFWSVYDGTDSYILKAKLGEGLNVPHPLAIYPVTKLAGAECRKLLVTDDGAVNGKVYLMMGSASTTNGKYSVSVIILDPLASRTYETGGTWYGTRMGDITRRSVVEEIVIYGVNCDSDDYWEVSLAWDEAAAAVVTGTAATSRVTTTGRTTLRPVAGTNDSGYLYQISATATLSGNTARPRLRGASALRQGPGGIEVRGLRQADHVEVITVVIDAARDGQAGGNGRIEQLAHEQYQALKALVGSGTVTLEFRQHFGNAVQRRVTVQDVRYTPTYRDGAIYPERLITVVLRVLRNSTA